VTEDLRGRLELLSTAELLEILSEHDLEEWRTEAFPIVEDILTARHVDVPAAVENLKAAAAYVDFQALSAIATFSTAVEAHLCRMALEEGGVQCWLFNDHLAGIHVPLGMAIGVGVRVRPEQAEAAREILAAVQSGPTATPGGSDRCPNCGSLDTTRTRKTDRPSTVFAWLLAGTPAPQSDWTSACSACGHRWE
jgi:hypothetical protein